MIDQSVINLADNPIGTLTETVVGTNRLLADERHRLVGTRVCWTDNPAADRRSPTVRTVHCDGEPDRRDTCGRRKRQRREADIVRDRDTGLVCQHRDEMGGQMPHPAAAPAARIQIARVRPAVARARLNRLIAVRLARKQTRPATTTSRQSCSVARHVRTRNICAGLTVGQYVQISGKYFFRVNRAFRESSRSGLRHAGHIVHQDRTADSLEHHLCHRLD